MLKKRGNFLPRPARERVGVRVFNEVYTNLL
jgi:hypothetical protein